MESGIWTEPARAKDRPCRRPPCPLPARRLHRARRGRVWRSRHRCALQHLDLQRPDADERRRLSAAGRADPPRAGCLGTAGRRLAALHRRGNLLRGGARRAGVGADPLARRRRLPRLLSTRLRGADRPSAGEDRGLSGRAVAGRRDRRLCRRGAGGGVRARADRRCLERRPDARRRNQPGLPDRRPDPVDDGGNRRLVHRLAAGAQLGGPRCRPPAARRLRRRLSAAGRQGDLRRRHDSRRRLAVRCSAGGLRGVDRAGHHGAAAIAGGADHRDTGRRGPGRDLHSGGRTIRHGPNRSGGHLPAHPDRGRRAAGPLVA